MSIHAVAHDGTRFVAAGGVGDPIRGLIWTSDDGILWDLQQELTDHERTTLPIIIQAVVAVDGLYAVGGVGPFVGFFPPVSFALSWASADGGTWSQSLRTSSSTIGDGPGTVWHVGSFNAVIPFQGGLLAVGHVPIDGASLPGPFFRQAVWFGTWVS